METNEVILIRDEVSQLKFEASQRAKKEAETCKGTAYMREAVKVKMLETVLKIIDQYIKK
jgi:hypothetical protein